jgi:hypothetical protein
MRSLTARDFGVDSGDWAVMMTLRLNSGADIRRFTARPRYIDALSSILAQGRDTKQRFLAAGEKDPQYVEGRSQGGA